MQILYAVEEIDHTQDTLLMTSIEDFLNIKPYEYSDAGPSIATESSERTMSYESTEESVSTECQNDEIQLEVMLTREGVAEQQTEIIELDKRSQEQIEGITSAADRRLGCRPSEVRKASVPIQGRIKKIR